MQKEELEYRLSPMLTFNCFASINPNHAVSFGREQAAFSAPLSKW